MPEDPLQAQATHEAVGDDLQEGDADADPANDGHLVHDELLEELDAAVLVDGVQVKTRIEGVVSCT